MSLSWKNQRKRRPKGAVKCVSLLTVHRTTIERSHGIISNYNKKQNHPQIPERVAEAEVWSCELVPQLREAAVEGLHPHFCRWPCASWVGQSLHYEPFVLCYLTRGWHISCCFLLGLFFFLNCDYTPDQNLATLQFTEWYILAERGFNLFLQSNEQDSHEGADLCGPHMPVVCGGFRRGDVTPVAPIFDPHYTSLLCILTQISPHLCLKGRCFSRAFLEIRANLSCCWPLETIWSSWSVNSQMARLKRKREIMEPLWTLKSHMLIAPFDSAGRWT